MPRRAGSGRTLGDRIALDPLGGSNMIYLYCILYIVIELVVGLDVGEERGVESDLEKRTEVPRGADDPPT